MVAQNEEFVNKKIASFNVAIDPMPGTFSAQAGYITNYKLTFIFVSLPSLKRVSSISFPFLYL